MGAAGIQSSGGSGGGPRGSPSLEVGERRKSRRRRYCRPLAFSFISFGDGLPKLDDGNVYLFRTSIIASSSSSSPPTKTCSSVASGCSHDSPSAPFMSCPCVCHFCWCRSPRLRTISGSAAWFTPMLEEGRWSERLCSGRWRMS